VYSGENKSHKARTCPKCKQAFSPDVSFCPDDGCRLPEELTTAISSEMLKFTGSRPAKKSAETEKQWPTGNGKSEGEKTHKRGSNREKLEHKQKRPDLLDISQELRVLHGETETLTNPAGSVARGDQPAAEVRTRDSVVNSMIGQTLDNQYEILEVVGQGGMSVVYKARHVMLKKIVAIKTLLPHLVLHPLSLQRFQQEAQAASNIVHTNVVTIYNFGITPEGQPYLVMDYLEGISLQDMILEHGHLPIDRALNIFLQVANALGLAHEKGVVHRDLKPSNIILIEQGDKKDIVQIVDFGIAKLLPQEGSEAMALTQTGEVFGSPLYMSPEQAKGDKLDSRSDIYSMGCLMYETLSGKLPHNGENALEVLYKHINDVPPPMSSGEIKIPHALEAIVFKALAKSPDLRYQSMLELEEDLESFQKAQQFSLIGILKSRWELARLKKTPRTKREKTAAKMTFAFAILAIIGAICGIAYPLVSFWGIADSPAAKQSLQWDDDRGKAKMKSNDLDVLATSLVKKSAMKFLEHPDVQDFGDRYSMCTSAARKLIEQAHYEDAVNVLDMALKIAKQYVSADSVLMIVGYQLRAEAYLNMGKFTEATKDYGTLIQMYKNEAHHQLIEETTQIAHMGDCYYFMEQYAFAAGYYTDAITQWFHADNTLPNKKYADEFGLESIPKLEVAAMCYSRLGEIYQKAANGEIRRIGIDSSGEEYGHAARLFYQALPMWRQQEGDGGKNTSLCELRLAEVLATHRQPDLKRVAKIAGGDKLAELDKDPESLFERAEAAMASKSSYGKSHRYYAIALLKHAQYRLNQHDLKNYISLRLQGCAILSSQTN
jgi:serine/threonine protein kinase